MRAGRRAIAWFGASAFLASALSPGCSHKSPSALASIAVTPASPIAELGTAPQLTATGAYSDGSTKDLTASAAWTSSDPSVAGVDAGVVATVAQGQATIQAAFGGVTGSTLLTVGPPGHHIFGTAGLWTQFERRGWPSEYWPGETVQQWNLYDSVVGSTVAQEVGLQLDAMAAMGVNAITFPLRTADPTATGNFTPPDCNEPPVLGLQYPQPTATELANLPLLFDLAHAKGVKVILELENSHMEKQPPTDSQTWIGAILAAVGSHPALDLVLFDGTPYVVGSSCGIPAEAPLWLGPTSVPATYVKWAIGYAMSLGVPASKLSAESIVGSFFLESQPPAGADATAGHLWSPVGVMKSIFDDLAIPAGQRTYALSFYEHRKCSDAQSLTCTDLGPHDWAAATLSYVTNLLGAGPRIVATEMGNMTPVDPQWSTQHAVESLAFLMRASGIGGGSFWRWTSFSNAEDSDPTLAEPVKRRGTAFVYNPVEREVVDLAGFHLPLVPNGSFEGAAGADGAPDKWTAAGAGSVTRYLLAAEPGQPEVPSRGSNAMRLVTGPGANDAVTATSVPIPVLPSRTFTTTANLRFAWTGDPNPSGPPASRPQVSLAILYLQASGAPSAVRPADTFSWFQEDATSGFGTFPVVYTTPGDAALVRVQIGAARNGLVLLRRSCELVKQRFVHG